MKDGPRILLIGGNGQLGRALREILPGIGPTFVAVREAFAPHDLAGVDITDADALRAAVSHVQPDVIVNATAFTAVDLAQSQPSLARAVNAIAPESLAQLAHRRGALLVHYSTDYVFDGSGELPWREDDRAGPLNVYGATKLEGEQAIRANLGQHLILRTSWLYGAHGGNFIRSMLRRAMQRDTLQVVNDQIGAPTAADWLAQASGIALQACLERPHLAGTYHLCASGETHWHAYAQLVLGQATASGLSLRCRPDRVEAISTRDYPTPAHRPLNSRLDTRRARDTFKLQAPDWASEVRRMLAIILKDWSHESP